MKKLKSPSSYGLPEEFHIFTMSKDDSSPSLISAVEILQELNNLWDIFLPLKILNIILDFVKTIYIEHTKAIRQQQEEKRKHLKLKETTGEGTVIQNEIHNLKSNDLGQEISGDDLLPIIIHCLIHANIERPLEIMYLCRQAGEEDSLTHSEGGYYLTMIECALEYIKAYQFQSSEIDIADFTKERNTLFSL